MRPEQMRHSLAFDRKLSSYDGHGGRNHQWDLPGNAVIARANVRFLRGGEAVQGARLQGTQPVVVTIYATPSARLIGVDWRVRDLRAGALGADGLTWSGVVYNITAPPVLTDDGRHIEITATSGEPA